MAKRKPIPYHATQAIDSAQMELADATRQLLPLMSGEPTTREELYRRIGLTLDRLHRASAALKEVRKQGEGN